MKKIHRVILAAAALLLVASAIPTPASANPISPAAWCHGMYTDCRADYNVTTCAIEYNDCMCFFYPSNCP